MAQNVFTSEKILHLVKEMAGKCPVFGIPVIGVTGSGKSTLVNNLLGRNSSSVSAGLDSITCTVSSYEMEVEGVLICVYDTPGLDDSRGDHDAVYLREMKGILESGEIQLVIYCLKLLETRMHQGLIRTFQEFNKISVNWEQTVIALTFADNLLVSSAEKKNADFKMDQFFYRKVEQWRSRVTETLVDNVGIQRVRAEKVVVRPTSDGPDDNLPNGQEWYIPSPLGYNSKVIVTWCSNAVHKNAGKEN